MKKSQISLLILLICSTACTPITQVPPAPTPRVSAATGLHPEVTASLLPAPASQVSTWPGLHPGWMTFHGTPVINDVAYDPAGYLWASVGTGLYRWAIETGATSYYSSADGLPKSISAIHFYDGQVWAVSEKGEIAHSSAGKWVIQTSDFGRLSQLLDTGNRLWVKGEQGLYYYEGQDWKKFDFLPKERQGYVNWIARSKDGSLWFSGYGEASNYVSRFDGKTWEDYPNLKNANKVLTTSDGTLWFVMNDLLVSHDGQRLEPLVLPGNYFRYYVQNTFLANDGALWLQTEGGTFTIHGKDIQEEHFDGFDQLPEGLDRSPIGLTAQGWLFHNRDNVYLLNAENVLKKYSPLAGTSLSPLVNSQVIGFAPDGTLWAWRSGKLAQFDGKKTNTISGIDGLSYGSISHIDANGVLWSMYPDTEDLYVGELGQKEFKRIDLRFPVSDFSFAPDGTLWLALTDGFIAKLSPADIKDGGFIDLDKIKITGNRPEDKLKPSRIEVGADGSIWVFVLDSGLYKYDGKTWTYHGIPLLGDRSAFAVGPDNKIWAGYNRSLYAYDGKKWQQYPNNCIFPSNVTIAPDQSVWFINGCDGVYRFDGKDWTHFEREKELQGIIPTRIIVAPDGALWFFSENGWARYQP